MIFLQTDNYNTSKLRCFHLKISEKSHLSRLITLGPERRYPSNDGNTLYLKILVPKRKLPDKDKKKSLLLTLTGNEIEAEMRTTTRDVFIKRDYH